MGIKLNISTRLEEKLLLLNETVLELLYITEVDTILSRITETAAFLTDAEESALFIFNENNNKLSLRALKGISEKKAKLLYRDVTDVLESPDFKSRKSLVLTQKEIEVVTGYPVYSFMCMPLALKEEVVGTLCVYNRQKKTQFTPDDKELIRILSHHTASAIKNPILLKFANIKADTFSDIYSASKRMLSEVELEKLLGIIIDTALQILDADIVILYEYLKELDDVKIPPLFKGKDIKSPGILKERGETHKESLIFKLLRRDRPFYAPNAREDWNTFYLNEKEKTEREGDFIHREGIVSSAGIPLRIENEPVGLLFINFRTYRPFTEDRRLKIESFANEAALAIRNARIFNQRNRYIEELSVLNRIIQEISSGVTLSTHAILNLIYEQTGHLMDVTNFFVAFYDKDTKIVSFEFAVEKGQIEQTGVGQWKERKAGNGLTEYVIRTAETLRISNNIYQWLDDHKVDPIGTPVKSWLGVPLIHEDIVLGVIVIQNIEKENAYDKRNEEILETIAAEAAIAIAKARHFQESQDQLAELNSLYKISQEIVSQSTGIMSVLNTILDKAVQISGADAGEILLYDDSTEEIKVVITHNIDILKDHVMNKGEGMAGRVISEGKSDFTNDYFNSPYVDPQLNKPEFWSKIKGVVQVPLKWRDDLLGVLSLSSQPNSNRIFTDKDVERLDHFAGSASIAIQIARINSFRQIMLDDNPAAIIAVDQKGWVTEFNKSSERIMGRSKDKVIGEHVKQLYSEGEKEAKRINHILIESEINKVPAKNIRTAVRGGNGEYIPILFSGVILRNELGERIGSIGLMTTLKEIEQLNEEYTKQQNLLKDIEQYPQDTPIDKHEDLQRRKTEILEKTRNFCQLDYIILFASTAENDTVLRAIAWAGLNPEIQKKLPQFNWKKAGLLTVETSKEDSLRKEVELLNQWTPDDAWKKIIISGIRGNNADFFHNLSCGVPIRLADNYRAVIVFGPFKNNPDLFKMQDFIRNIAQTINISALSWLQALHLRARSREAERSKKLIVHRSRMQLQQIIGKFGLIKSESTKESSIHKEAEKGESLVEHLSYTLTGAIKSHITELEPADFNFQSFPLPVLIENSVEGFRERAIFWRRGLEIDLGVEFLPYAEIDPLMLSVALGNLIENALKYSFEKTTIKILSEYNQKEAKIIVQDYGDEMSEKARENLYKPGMRWGMTERARGIPGTGFGLWDTSVIVNAHGGKLDFTSGYYEMHDQKKRTYLVKVWMVLPLKKTQKLK